MNRSLAWRDQLIFLTAICMLVGIPWLYTAQYHKLIQDCISQEQLQTDVIALNEGWIYFTKHSQVWNDYDKNDNNYPFFESYYCPTEFNDILPSKAQVFRQEYLDDRKTKIQKVDAFIQAYERLHGDDIPGTAEAFVHEYERGTLLFKLDYNDKYKLDRQIDIISNAKFRQPFWSQSDHGFFYLLSLILAGTLVMISAFRQVNWKPFALAAGLGMALVFGLALITQILYSFGMYDSEYIIFFAILALFGISTFFGFSSFSSRSWARINLILTSGTLISMPIFLLILLNEEMNLIPDYILSLRVEKLAVILAVVLAPLLWQMVYRPKLISLESSPSRK